MRVVSPRELGQMTRTARFGILVGLLLAAALAAEPASGQTRNEFRELLKRVEQVEENLQSLRRGGAPARVGGAVPAGSIEALVERQETMGAELDRQVREVTDTVERVRFEVTNIARRMDKLVRDIDRRLAELEASVAALREGAAPAPAPAPAQDAAAPAPAPAEVAGTPPETPAAPDLLPRGTPLEQYGHAQNLLKQFKFGEAELALKDFLHRHPDHDLAENARYWLGETFFVRKDYEAAARTFLEGYQASKQGRKAPDNLLKLGISLRRLGQDADACTTLRELVEGYRLAAANLLDRARTEISELGCG